MAITNDINSNFYQIAVSDADDRVWGITTAPGNLLISGGTAGQLLSATGTGNCAWTSSASSLPLNEFTHAGADTNAGTVTTFTLSGTAVYKQAAVYVNGVLLQFGEYNIAGTTLSVSRALTTGDIISVGPVSGGVISTTVNALSADIANVAISGGTIGDYLATSTVTGNVAWVTPPTPSPIQEFTAASTGTNQTFTLTNSNFTSTTASVYVNGVLQRSSEYSIAGTTLTLSRSLTTGDQVSVGPTTGAIGGAASTSLLAASTGSVAIGGGTAKQVLSSTGGSGTTWALPVALNAAAVGDVNIAGGTTNQALVATGTGSATAWRNMPAVFGFSAKLAADLNNFSLNATYSGPIPFNTVLSSSGTGYSNTTGRYTVPVSGLYNITTTVNIDLGGATMTASVIGLYKNGTLDRTLSQLNATHTAFVASGATMIPLTAGDIYDIRIVVVGGSSIIRAVNTFFSVYYLAPTV